MAKIRAYEPDGKGGVRVSEIDEPDVARIEREKAEKLNNLAAWLQTNGVSKLTDLVAKVAALEDKAK